MKGLTQNTFEPDKNIEEIVSRLNKLANDGQYVFRGYSKKEEMKPKLIRKEDYRDKERDLLFDFEKYGSSYFHATTPIDFMSYAQHFGIPTRLLDFTYNPYIALSFSIHDPKDPNTTDVDDNDYYYIQYASVTENIKLPYILYGNTWNDLEMTIDSLAKKSMDCIRSLEEAYNTHSIKEIYRYESDQDKEEDQKKLEDKAIMFIDPNQSNQRIIMQQGLFMFPYTLDEALHEEIINKHSKTIKIHKCYRSELLNYLDTLGYNTFRLMPDLRSVCEAIRRKYAVG